MVYRIYVEKKAGLAAEADGLKSKIVNLLGIKGLTGLRLLNRYDAEGLDKDLFDYCTKTVFSEPQLDDLREALPTDGAVTFAVEYLPGQFDQRAASAAECIQIISKQERPLIRSAKVYVLYGELSDADVVEIKKFLINPVESREASLEPFATLDVQYEIPTEVATVEGFIGLDEAGLDALVKNMGLAMDLDDIKVCQNYFLSEQRDPTITEIKMIDTYWSDHCRHTTFNTTIDSIQFEDELLQKAYQEYLATRAEIGRTKPINLMDIGTIAAKLLKKEGKLDGLDESEEINACTVKIDVDVEGETQKWLLLFKNETHNHPTEIEPFGGAATCVGGAIRDPLSGRSYVYAAMRVTGAADPLKPVSETIKGKLPQRTIVTTAAAGYSSYGNQIGLATGQVDELYHPGYVAKRMEIGAVIAAAPAENVRRERPADSDIVILLGGKTGRDGCGGATGSSKSHTVESLESCGAEVQKGNAPEERKLQRLFRNPEASKLIKRCNDFGAGGVSVAIGELADGLEINLDAVPKKYDGLDGTELAISESQERMAVVVAAKDVERFKELAYQENLEATVVAKVTEEPTLKMTWNGKQIVHLSRAFLDSNGAEKHIDVAPAAPEKFVKEIPADFKAGYMELAQDLNICSKRGLSERFDSTIGAGTVLMPFGGKNQKTPIQAMVNKVSVEKKDTTTCSLMAWGYNPFIAEKSPYHSAYLAVVESVAKLIATGASFREVYLSFQEYFEKLGKDARRWGKPLAALLGAFMAQKGLEIAAIGGKDSMSGSFEDIDVPPTLVSFAVTVDSIRNIISPEFKAAGHKVVLLKPEYDAEGLPTTDSLKALFDQVTALMRSGKVAAAYTPTLGGVAEAVLKMTMGNDIGFTYEASVPMADIFGYNYGAFVLELTEEAEIGTLLGTTGGDAIVYGTERIPLTEIFAAYEQKLEEIYPMQTEAAAEKAEIPAFTAKAEGITYHAKATIAKPRVLIPVFPGTNCEFDSAKAVERAGAEANIFVINNLSAAGIADSIERFAKEVKQSQTIFIPGGFSGGDEPDGSGKFITAFFRNPEIKEEVTKHLQERDGLMIGICNGFQALIKLGLVPFGEIIDTDETCPTLSYNTISRHQSKIVRVRLATEKSPWLTNVKAGDIFSVPISHGEGRILMDDKMVQDLAAKGQILTQYVDEQGLPTNDIQFNPNGSTYAIEGLISPDGRVLGKMGHAERIGAGLYQNVAGNYDMKLFRSMVEYFK